MFPILLILSPLLLLIHLVNLPLLLICLTLTYLPPIYLPLHQIYPILFLLLHLHLFLSLLLLQILYLLPFLILFHLWGNLPESVKLLLICKITNAIVLFMISLILPIQPSSLVPSRPCQVLHTFYLITLILLVYHPLMPIFVPLSLLFLSPNLTLRLSKILSGRMLRLMRLQHWNLIRHGLSLPYLLTKRQLGANGYIGSSLRLMGQWKSTRQGLWLKDSPNKRV